MSLTEAVLTGVALGLFMAALRFCIMMAFYDNEDDRD